MIEASSPAYRFITVPGDPLDVRQYTLANGMKLFLSISPNEPRIHTNIAVRAGSKQDPPETTGLAHYMEHMLFKGTSRIGAMDWEKEKVYLEKISDLYEQHRAAQTDEERQAVYREIDRLSFEAARMVAPNEYDKLVSAMGAKDTNAYTWVEQTVYVNDIPSNELERWMKLESERFSMMALRLFHTELETVYEEFNISQDRDFRKVSQAIRETLFPIHPYGTQTTIGRPEHLKNPSHVNIQKYFQTYYVPNNMAIVLAGDFDPDQAVALAEKYFGSYQPREIPPFAFDEQPPIDRPVFREVFGQESPYVEIAWRFGSSQSDDQLMIVLLQGLLYNQQAGLLDLNLNQQQRVLESEAWTWMYEDYSVFGLYGKPREGQSLEEVTNLLLAEIEKIKKGEFESWLPEAVITDLRLMDRRASESNRMRVQAITNAFILGVGWNRFVHRFDRMSQVSKEQLMAFAQRRLNDNYVAVFKRQGEDPNVIKVQKPPITPVELDRTATSEFAKTFLAAPAPNLQPVFADFEAGIQKTTLSNGLSLEYVHNPDNDLFRLDYIFEMGKTSDRKLSLAFLYLPYLGTDRYSAAELQQQFFRLGLTFDVYSGDDRIYITLSGLEESLEKGIQLLEHILQQVQPDGKALDNVVSDILLKRENAKKDRSQILRYAFSSYARYGADSPFSYRLSAGELKEIQPEELTQQIQSLCHYEHQVVYYGRRDIHSIVPVLEQYHRTPAVRKPVLAPKSFTELDTLDNKVYLLDFPIVQTDIMLLSKGTGYFNLEEHLLHEWYNDYFGTGLSSIVFQDIRESKALAYSTYAYYSSPRKKDRAHYLQAYVGTQPDKIQDAIPALVGIIEKMPVAETQIENARQSILRQIESERIVQSRMYWAAQAIRDLGLNHDLRRDLYEKLRQSTLHDLTHFQEKFVRGRKFTFLVLGTRSTIDRNYLEQVGPVEELTMEQVFGY